MPALAATFALPLAGCDGVQSALVPAGAGSAAVAGLFHWLVGGAALVWLLVIGIAAWAARARASRTSGLLLIVGGGVALPAAVLFALLFYALRLTGTLTAPGDGLVVYVNGAQYWWRVRYEPPAGAAVESANEIRLPAGQRVEFRLTSSDVIHSFWAPALGGKMDMIPGRETRLVLEPLVPGEYRGACAEFCGESHARMAFAVVVMEPAEFAAWLEQEGSPAVPPATDVARRGARVFIDSGCGACHRVAGTRANGRVGPDLTHAGGRRTLAAGTLPVGPGAFARWVGHPRAVKPGAHMPPYAEILSIEEREALGVWLTSLK